MAQKIEISLEGMKTLKEWEKDLVGFSQNGWKILHSLGRKTECSVNPFSNKTMFVHICMQYKAFPTVVLYSFGEYGSILIKLKIVVC